MEKTLHSPQGKAIAKFLTRLRDENTNLIQETLAAKLGREQSFIGNIERGQRRVDLFEFYQICKGCNVCPAQAAAELMEILENMSTTTK
ncbi:helix-turn-helix domain-containing protein [Porticoccus sp. GXU_MW_L64]